MRGPASLVTQDSERKDRNKQAYRSTTRGERPALPYISLAPLSRGGRGSLPARFTRTGGTGGHRRQVRTKDAQSAGHQGLQGHVHSALSSEQRWWHEEMALIHFVIVASGIEHCRDFPASADADGTWLQCGSRPKRGEEKEERVLYTQERVLSTIRLKSG